MGHEFVNPEMVERMKGKIKDLFKEWRILLVIVAVIGSVIAIYPNPQAKGVLVESVKEGSPFKGRVEQGAIIQSINEEQILNERDLFQFENYTGMLRVIHNGEVSLINLKKPGLGLEVKPRPKTNLNLGMDFVGGIRVLLKPLYKNTTLRENVTKNLTKKELVDRTISTLKTRMNIYGLKEMSFQSVKSIEGEYFVQIEMAGASKKEINELLGKQGEFEAFIPRLVEFENGKGNLTLQDKTYSFSYQNGSIIHKENKFNANGTFYLDDLYFKVWNVSSNRTILGARVFTSRDIKHVYMYGREAPPVRKSNGGYEFKFQVLVSDEGAERFAKVTSDIPIVTDPTSEEKKGHLRSNLHLFIDKKEVSSLRIVASLKGRAYTTPLITGGAATREDAEKEKRKLQSILRSGALPVKVKTVRIDKISASLGKEFLKSVVIAGFGALLTVIAIVYLRYREKKIILPMVLISLCEILIILGVASLIQWTIDLAAIAGIIAAIGTGVDDQIIMSDESLRGGREIKYGIKQKIKRAFFIVLGAAATTIAAMTPLMFIGIGVMRGFAITTIIGVLVGISITRPAYGKILEKIS